MSVAARRISSVDAEIASDCATFYADPLGWVYWAFPWGEGELEGQEGPDTWQADLLRQWGQEIQQRGFDGVTPVPPIQFGVASGHGIGKLSPCNSRVFTPEGERRWGDLKPGDKVFGQDGSPTTVLQIHPYNQVPIYRVSFDDGSHLDVSSGHLWNVRGRQERRNKLDTWRTLETIEILNLGVKRPNGVAQARQWEIPVQGAAQFDERDVPLHPYLVGVWIGDGHKGQARYSKPYDEVADRIRSLGYNVTDGNRGVRYVSELKNLPSELFTLLSHERCIPDDYKFNTAENRMELFRGLMDTDGEVHKAGSIGYSTTSKQLADDVVWLARSLGCKAMIQPTVKKGWYPDENGKRVECRDCYRVTINAPFNPFTIEHRRSAYKPSEPRYLTRWIDSIEFIGHDDGICITVSNEDGLYQGDHFIVTHNSALSSWIILFIMSTRPHSKGIVTANTSDQLRTKTWSELGKWRKMCITGHWFEYNNGRGSMSIYHLGHPETWRVDAQTCREENSESFAGLHAAGSTPFYLFDEGSAVPDKIYEVAEGGKTDGEPMHFVFGNPTRNTGRFHEIFHKQKHRWITRQIDSRTAKMTNKKLLQEWIDDYGIDSDFVRVRVLGRFPKAGDMQFIPHDIVAAASCRTTQYLPDDPLICGVDVARGGADNNMIQFRRGFDAVSEKAYRIPGEKTRDSMKLVSKLCDIFNRHKPHAIFLDSGGLGGPIGDRLRQLGYPVIDVGFGDNAADEKLYKSRTAEMWDRMRRWLFAGGCIKNHPTLESDLTNRLYDHNDKMQLVLERKKDMKARGLASPDWGDALALTFAEQVPALNRQPSGDYATARGVVNKKVVRNPLDRLDSE